MLFNVTNNILVISWRPVLLLGKTTDLSQVTDKLYNIKFKNYKQKKQMNKELYRIPIVSVSPWFIRYIYLWNWQFSGADPGVGAHPAPPNLNRYYFFGVKPWFFKRNTPNIFAPRPPPPNLKSWIRSWFLNS